MRGACLKQPANDCVTLIVRSAVEAILELKMSSDIITLLQLDRTFSSRIIVVREINRCDGSFITSSILNHCIKNKIGVLLLSTHNSLQHYQNVGLRINYNLQRYIESGLVDLFNFGECCVNSLLVDNKLPELFPAVNEKILSLQQKYETIAVILDGISHLFDLNYTLQQVNSFCKDLSKLVTSHNNSFIVYHCNEANENDVTCTMSNLLSHKACTVLEVENLPSGLSADVSGHLSIRYPSLKFHSDHLYTTDMKVAQYLFKLFDRGVKLLAPGMV